MIMADNERTCDKEIGSKKMKKRIIVGLQYMQWCNNGKEIMCKKGRVRYIKSLV